MAEVLGTNEQTAALDLLKPTTTYAGGGKVFIRMEEVEHQHDLVTLKVHADQVRIENVFCEDAPQSFVY